ncbi:hypothetical protein DVH05_002526 [Phytophthora capsici]|nr:hypothetical protein DVH05_002526 [Phytophthora capsici]
MPGRPPSQPLRATQTSSIVPHAKAGDGLPENDLDITIIELLSQYRPELLVSYIAKTRQGKGIKRRGEAPPDTFSCTETKRARVGFQPTGEQVRVHNAVTSLQHQGKSNDAFVDYVVSLAVFVAHPGVTSRAYDLRFGRFGLSVMHFKRLGFLDNLRALAPGTASMFDFLVAAPSPAVPRSWADLSSATRTFVEYCREMCDSTTVRVAEALDAFILSLEGWRQLEDDELPLLVL